MENPPTPTSEQLREAVVIKNQIETLEARLATLLYGGGRGGAVAVPGKRRGRKPGSKNKPKDGSDATAAVTATVPIAKKKSGKKNRKMSAEAKARISAAQKAIWAKRRKAKKAK